MCSRFRIVFSTAVGSEIVVPRFREYNRQKTATARASAHISPALRALMHANARCFPWALPKPTKGFALWKPTKGFALWKPTKGKLRRG